MKGNMLLGYGRGSVGDVTFYRRDGKQCARARNRSPRNPKTNPQLITRAIMATVNRAYSAGKAIFDHSFEGKSVPGGNQRYFLKRNADHLRALLASDMAGTTVNLFKGVGPSTITPVPGLFCVSEGTLVQDFFQKTAAASAQVPAKVGIPAVADADETLAAYMSRLGLTPGDIYTFVAFGLNSDEVAFEVANGVGAGATENTGKFAFVRLTVIEPLVNKAQGLASAAKLGDFMEIESYGNIRGFAMLEIAPGASINVTDAITFSVAAISVRSYGIIRSEDNSGLRSTEYMEYATYAHDEGLNSDYILAAWQQGSAKLGDSSLILEGGSF